MTTRSKQVNSSSQSSNSQISKAESESSTRPSATPHTLAVYLGETYAEFEIHKVVRKNSKKESVFKKTFFLPQTSLKTALNVVQKHLDENEFKVETVLIVCRYLERLKTFRLGGSVVQVVHEGFENSYVVENTQKVSLAANALAMSIKPEMTSDDLRTEFNRIKKINPDANKVVFQLDPKLISTELYQMCLDFFKEQQFKIFQCDTPHDLISIRHHLLNAGSEGTKEEIVSEFQEHFPGASVAFWIRDQFVKTDSEGWDNTDLYFSSLDFMTYHMNRLGKTRMIHFDIENWMILTNQTKNIWNSPWGKIDRNHPMMTQTALQPLTEILIDETSRLQFSKVPASSEPGPMIAGRGVKSLLVDLFFTDLLKVESFTTLFPNMANPALQSKIQSQFKVLENGQKTISQVMTQSDLKQFVYELLKFELELHLESPFNQLKEAVWTGNLAFLIQPQAQNFSWTELILNYGAEN